MSPNMTSIIDDLVHYFNALNSPSLLTASKKLADSPPSSENEQVLIQSVSTTNVLGLFLLAHRRGLKNLLQRCIECLHSKRAIIKKKKLTGLTQDEIALIMKELNSTKTLHIYCFGGSTKRMLPVVHVSHKELHEEEWKAVTNMPTNRALFAGAVVGTRIYIAGGIVNYKEPLQSMDMYDCLTNTWTSLAPMPEHRNNFAMAALDGYLYAVGGSMNSVSVKVEDPRSCGVRYCIATNTWESIAPLMISRMGHQLVELNGYLYAIGGLEMHQTPSVEKYDPKTNRWTFVADSHLKYPEPGAVAHYGKIYVCSYDAFEVYTPETNTWKLLQPPSEFQKSNRQLVSVDGKLLSFGGSYNSTYKRSVIEYDVAGALWRRVKALDIERDEHCSFVVHF